MIQRLTNGSLRSLALRGFWARFPASAWASLLAQFPQLESLTLEYVLPEAGLDQHQEQYPVPSKVHLPNLLELVMIDDNIDVQMSMLRCIVPADNARIIFKSRAYRLEALEQSFKALEETFMAMRSKPTFRHPTALHINTPTSFEALNPIQVFLSAPPESFHGCYNHCEGFGEPCGILELSLEVRFDSVSPRKFCETICNMLSKSFLISQLKTVCWGSMRFHYFRDDLDERRLDTGTSLVIEDIDWESLLDLEPLPKAFGEFFYQLANVRDLFIPNVYLDSILSQARGDATVQPAVIEAADRGLQLCLAALDCKDADREN
ncbi:hypothetical protein EIP86_001569 [Pleurotus ostreatoroseus]|nr:hypothetical protein EIP86_001569 [Pleurotus ostreatoroseus]